MRFKHGEYYANETLEELKLQDSIDGLKIFTLDENRNAFTIYKIQDVSTKEYENEWRVTYAEINVNDVECDLNCFDCDFCSELEKKEEDGETLPKTHKDKTIHQKLDEIFTAGIEVRLLNKNEYIERLKEKVRKGYRIFLFDPIKPITIEEIDRKKDEIWCV